MIGIQVSLRALLGAVTHSTLTKWATMGMVPKKKHRTRGNLYLFIAPSGRFSFCLQERGQPVDARGFKNHSEEQHANEDRLDPILPFYRTDHQGVLGDVRTGRVEFFTDQGVVASADKERQLMDLGRARDLDCTGELPGFGKEQGFGIEGAEEENKRRAFSGHPYPHR